MGISYNVYLTAKHGDEFLIVSMLCQCMPDAKIIKGFLWMQRSSAMRVNTVGVAVVWG